MFKGLTSLHTSKTHIITSQIEHKCIFEVCDTILDYDVTYLSVESSGRIDIDKLKEGMH